MNTAKLRARRAVFAAVALLAVPALSGCGGGGDSGSTGRGTLQVALVDAPDPLITSAEITIGRVEAHVGNSWVPITTVPATFNLLDLRDNEAILGSAGMPAGRYTQIRLFPTSATVTDSEGTHDVFIPSGVQTGVKVNVNYEISDQTITTVLLDFNVKRSFVRQGNGGYHLQPVIPAVVKVLSGTVTGTVTSGGVPVNGASVTATYTAGPSYAVGTEVNGSSTQADGTFKIWALLPGTYTITATYTDASDVVTVAAVTGVEVNANQNTAVGTLALQ